jgi:hypothetical protein
MNTKHINTAVLAESGICERNTGGNLSNLFRVRHRIEVTDYNGHTI